MSPPDNTRRLLLGNRLRQDVLTVVELFLEQPTEVRLDGAFDALKNYRAHVLGGAIVVPQVVHRR